MIHDVGLVAAREVTEKIRSRGFLIFTAVMAVVLPGAVLMMGLLGGYSGQSRYDIVTTGKHSTQLSRVIEQRAEASDATVGVREVSRDHARRAVRDGAADAAVLNASRVLVDGSPGSQLIGLVRSSVAHLHAVRTLRGAGVADEQVRKALSPQPLHVVSVGEDQSQQAGQEGDVSGTAIILVGVVLLFFALVIYGSWVASGIVEEKASRVVEVVLATVRPVRLLAGKVLGIGVLALGQLAFSVALGVAVAVAMDVTLPPVTLVAVASVLLWFVLGFGFYCCIFAVAGSLVSKQEDLQYTQMPALLPIIAGYFLAMQSQIGGVGPALAHALAYVPLFSPMMMPVLSASGEVAGWEVGIAAVLTAAAAVVLMRVAARLYTGSVLRFGARVSLREAWK